MMTSLDCQIGGKQGEISARALRIAVQQTVGLLDEYDAVLYGKSSPSLRWNVWEMSSTDGLLIRFKSQLAKRRKRTEIPDKSGAVAAGLIEGINIIDRDAQVPPYLSEYGFHRIEEMTRVIEHKEADSFTLRTDGHFAAVTHDTSARLAKVAAIKRAAVGSVEGRLVGISVAKQHPRITIIHHLSNKSIGCQVDSDQLEQVKAALGKRVVVYGTLHKNEAGDTIRVTMRELHEITRDYIRNQLAGISDLPVPDFAEQSDTEKYLNDIRG